MKFQFVSKKTKMILHENIDDHKMVECPICGLEIVPYWEPKYNGIRATCDVCGVNWAES